MAQRRMFCKEITSSDSFTDLPLAAQALYLHITMDADDDGLVSGARKIARSIGASPDDLQALLEAGFLLDLGDNVICIKHWRMNNYIQKDRYKPSVYGEKMAMLYVKPNKAYTLNPAEGVPAAAADVVENSKEPVNNNNYIDDTENSMLEAWPEEENPQSVDNSTFDSMDTECIQSVSKMDTQVSIGKVSIGKDSIESDNSFLSSSSQKHARGKNANVYLTDSQLATLQSKYIYPEGIINDVGNYLLSARDRPPDQQNHYALCLKFAREYGAPLRQGEA